MHKIAGLLYSYYPQDTRPLRESEALVEAGMQVDMICLRHKGQKAEETINGVNVYRLPMQMNREGKLAYIIQYAKFILLSLVKLSLLYFREKYDIIHVHNMPDILVVSAILPKLFGSKVILDLHDPMPELFMTKYWVPETHLAVRLLARAEAFSIRFADMVITPNISFRNLFMSRGCPEEKIFIVMNSPVDTIFSHKENTLDNDLANEPDKFVIMFHGSIFERQGVDTAVEAIATLRNVIQNIEFRVFGHGDYVKTFLKLVEEHKVQDIVKFHGSVSLDQISREIQKINVGIIPNKKNPFTDLNMPVRIFEYLKLGKAVIVPKTQGILDYFDDNSIVFFDAGDSQSLYDAILRVYNDKETIDNIVMNGSRVCDENRWELQKKILVERVSLLLSADKDAGTGRFNGIT